MEISCLCRACGAKSLVSSPSQGCEACGKALLNYKTEAFESSETLNQCPVCGAAHLYRQKDFNRKIGVGLLVIGIALAYWTYGLSLLAVTLFDWALSRYIPEAGLCYQCHSVFRTSPAIQKLEPFNLELHDYYRSIAPTGLVTAE